MTIRLKAVAFRVIVKPEEIITDHEVKGTDIRLALALDEKIEKGARIVGTVVDIGPDVYAAFKTTEEYAGLKIGDRVYFARYAGKTIVHPETKEEYVSAIRMIRFARFSLSQNGHVCFCICSPFSVLGNICV